MEHENRQGFPYTLLIGGLVFAGGAYYLLSRTTGASAAKDGDDPSSYDPTRSNFQVGRDDCTPLLEQINTLRDALAVSYDDDMAVALAVAQEQYANMDCGGMPVIVGGAAKSLPYSV